MNLTELANQSERKWVQVRDSYKVTKKPRDLDVRSHSQIPFIPMESIPLGGVYEPEIVMKSPDSIASGTYFERGDILVAKITPSFENGKQALVRGISLPFGYATTEVIPLRPISDKQDDPRLLFFYLLHPDVRHYVSERMEGSTGRQRVSEHLILDLPFPTIEPNEQKKISDILEMIQKAITTEAQAIVVANQLKKATMSELFTRGLKSETQKETDVGLVPDSWACKKLGDIAEIAYGAQAAVANATDPSIGTLILTNVNLDLDGHINLEKKRYYKIPPQHQDRLTLRKGDVLFNWRSGSADHIGKTVYFDLDGEFTYSSFILRFRSFNSVSNKYLFRWLTHLRVIGFFTAQRNISSINSVYNASLSATIPVWFPKENEQSEIVNILDSLDEKILLHKEKKIVLESLFSSLLHKLITNEIRVNDLNLKALNITSQNGTLR